MNSLLNIVKKHWVAFTLVIAAAVSILSLWPLDELPPVPGTDKIHHIIAYAILVLPVALRKPNKWAAYIFIFVAYSGAIELIQPFVNRYGEWLDMVANTGGVVLGLLIAELLNFISSGRFKRK